MHKNSIIWFRKDLRIQDNLALLHAAKESESILPIYFFEAQEHGAANKWWLHHSLVSLERSLNDLGLPLVILKANPILIIPKIIKDIKASAIYWNRCYEPYAIARDTAIKKQLLENGISAKSFNSSLLFDPWEIKNVLGEFFKVFTPFWKKCMNNINSSINIESFSYSKLNTPDFSFKSLTIDELNLLPQSPDWSGGLREKWLPNIGEKAARQKLDDFIKNKLKHYKEGRDFPIKSCTSELSPHLHFGEIGPRQIYQAISKINDETNCDKFLSEIGWREFSYYLLYHFPNLPNKPFQAKFENFSWQENKGFLKAWQKGRTGYPIIDAGMRELTITGTMHNRVRMLVASFLVKDLLIQWQEGAQWFLDRLVDADLASNSASWQWVAGSGADAAPYFRIFNPVLQSRKFDPKGEYIKKWIPELSKLSDKYIHAPWEATDLELQRSSVILGKTYPLKIIERNVKIVNNLYCKIN